MDPHYCQYRDELRRFFARYSHNAHNADDLVQELYERLLRYSPRTPVRNPEAYVFQAARNVLRAANQSLWTQRQRYLFCEPAELDGRAQTARHLWIEEEGGADIAMHDLERVLSQLPRTAQIALVRQRRDGWTHQQIADELGVSINTVKDYLGKAFNHFRIHFSLQEE